MVQPECFNDRVPSWHRTAQLSSPARHVIAGVWGARTPNTSPRGARIVIKSTSRGFCPLMHIGNL